MLRDLNMKTDSPSAVSNVYPTLKLTYVRNREHKRLVK
jgi:hypothetical protein